MANKNISRLLDEIKSNRGKFYVYILRRPTGEPFYVGYSRSGIKPVERIFQHESEAVSTHRRFRQNLHKIHIIRKIIADGYSIVEEIFSWHVDLVDAKNKEVELILRFGRVDIGTGILTNMTAGGDGSVELSQDGRLRMKAGQKKGAAGRALWAKNNSELQSAQGRHLAKKRTEWALNNPALDSSERSKAGKIGGRKSMELLSDRPELRKEMRARAGEASRQWSLDNPELSKSHGKKVYKVGIGKWATENPELAQELRLKGTHSRISRILATPGEMQRRMSEMSEKAHKWRENNPESMSANGNRQGERNRRKSVIRSKCISLVKANSLVITPPNGRSGLSVWEDFLIILQKMIASL